MKLVGEKSVDFGVRVIGAVCMAALITTALIAFAVLILSTTAEAQQTESTGVTKVQYNQKQVQRTDSESDTKTSPRQSDNLRAGGASATTKDGCVRAEAGDAVAEVGCDEQDGDGGNGDNGDGSGDGDDGDNGGDEGDEGSTDDPNAEPGSQSNPLPEDEQAGPLEGAEAIGEDIDVKGDVIGTDPETGDDVVGIDTITIETENCEITDPDDLSVTLRILDGGPGRFIDGPEGAELDNAEITVDEGQVVIRGQGPGNVVEPFFVEGQAQPGEIFVQETFEVISSTGIGGEGCRAAQASDDGNPTNQDDVVPGTDPGGDLADTGGPLLGLMVAGLILTGGGLLLRSTMRRG